MVEQLFGSKTRVKLLKLFFSNPNRSFYVREITRKIDEQINSVRRELANMLSLGLITSDSSDHKLYYEINQDYEHYDALTSMFGSEAIVEDSDAKPTSKKAKSTKKSGKSPAANNDTNDNNDTKVHPKAAKDPTKTPTKDGIVELPEAVQWSKVGNVSGVAYSGVYTRDESANVDIVVVGDVSISRVEAVIVDLEKEKKRELRYAVMEVNEWSYRRQVRDKFWLQFMGAKKLVVLDKTKLFVD